MALAMAIAGLRNFGAHEMAFRERGLPGDPRLRGRYIPRENVGLSRTRGLHDATVGIIGASATGRYLIRLLGPFGPEVRILVYDPYLGEEQAQELGVRKVELEELLRASDVVSLHAPLTEESRGMIGARELGLMKDGAVLVNTARGGLVDHDALYDEAAGGRIGACLDVYFGEGCDDAASSRFRGLPNVLITPGIAGPTSQVLRQMGTAVVQDIETFFRGGEPKLRVDPGSLSHMA
jgi:phosphoglycerate dehydrogenase-like enzyme